MQVAAPTQGLGGSAGNDEVNRIIHLFYNVKHLTETGIRLELAEFSGQGPQGTSCAVYFLKKILLE